MTHGQRAIDACCVGQWHHGYDGRGKAIRIARRCQTALALPHAVLLEVEVYDSNKLWLPGLEAAPGSVLLHICLLDVTSKTKN